MITTVVSHCSAREAIEQAISATILDIQAVERELGEVQTALDVELAGFHEMIRGAAMLDLEIIGGLIASIRASYKVKKAPLRARLNGLNERQRSLKLMLLAEPLTAAGVPTTEAQRIGVMRSLVALTAKLIARNDLALEPADQAILDVTKHYVRGLRDGVAARQLGREPSADLAVR